MHRLELAISCCLSLSAEKLFSPVRKAADREACMHVLLVLVLVGLFHNPYDLLAS